MISFKCNYCGSEKIIRTILKDYVYKKTERSNGKVVYFCSHDCMRKAEKENPNRFAGRRL